MKIQVLNEEPVELETMAKSFADRIVKLFALNDKHERPFWGHDFPFKKDPHFRDLILFYEYFNPETGKGLGAMHQAGWTATVANILAEK